MNDHSLRLLTALTFIPAFPLCLAHGINSGRAVPAVGLVPLAGSAVFAIFLIQWKKQREDATPVHPAILYVVDSVLATGLMIVLVYTWVDLTWVTRSQTMLAAYATFPLLVNFFIHFYFAVHTFYFGLGIDQVLKYLAGHFTPSECPNCHHQLRPARPTVHFPRISVPQMSIPNVGIPWTKRTPVTDEEEPLLVNEEGVESEGEAGTSYAEVVEGQRVNRKGRKGRDGEETGAYSP